MSDFATWLNESSCVRLAPSARHGVGVFAICDIPAGQNPFPGIKKRHALVRMSQEEVDALAPHVRKLVVDFCIPRDGVYFVYKQGFAAMDMSFFMNNSKDEAAAPNVVIDSNPGATLCTFVTARDVKAGEELVFNYT